MTLEEIKEKLSNRLPKGWSQRRADAFDAAIHAVHSRGEYPSAGRIEDELGRKRRGLDGGECERRHRVFARLGIQVGEGQYVPRRASMLTRGYRVAEGTPPRNVRHLWYVAALKLLKKLRKDHPDRFAKGLCYVMERASLRGLGPLWTPELHAMMPADFERSTRMYWWPVDADGDARRIAALEECIELTK